MKKIVVSTLMLFFATFISCSNNDEESEEMITPTISESEINFTVAGGEQIINIASIIDWECDYTANWLLVRQQQDKIRVIADPNKSAEDRTASIHILYDNVRKEEIIVKQEGTSLNIERSSLSVENKRKEISIPIFCNTEWSVENSIEWCNVKKEDASLVILVSRNYQMLDRRGTLTVRAGDLSKVIAIEQSASPWYESFEMIFVESGSFYMGAQKEVSDKVNYDESAYIIEAPVHYVTVKDYNIGKFEVTQAQWIAAMGDNPSIIQGDSLPVENVTWEQVQEFISLLNKKSGKEYRLPTEAEWEFAAKGGRKSENFKYSGYSVLGACGWYYSNSDATTHEIGSKYPNELGIFDMSGNVREWCNDWFEYYSLSDADNPQGPDYGSMKVNRGGSWTTPAINCRNTYRHTDSPYEASQDLGFRLALSNE